jgi:two-component system response regulator HydG
LRHLAEETVRKEPPSVQEPFSPEQMLRNFHELQVYQVELEMQNDELRHTQAELLASMSRYDNAPVGYLTVSERGLIQEANLTAATMLGVMRNDLLKKPISQFIFHEDQDVYSLHRSRYHEENEIQCWEMRMTRAAGFPFWARLQAVSAPNGEYWISMIDITELKQKKLLLAENEARLRALVRSIPDLVWLKNVDGIYLACNRMFERFFGAKEEDIVGKTDYDFVDRELADSFREHDRKAMAAGEPTSNEEWITFKDNGQRALLETVKTPMYYNEGQLIGVLGIARDITGRMQAEEERLKMEREYQQTQIFQTISDSIIMVNTEGCLANFNAAAEIVCGYTVDMIGRKITEIDLGFGDILLETISGNFPLEIRRFELRTPEGKNRIFSLRATPVTELDGTVSGAVAVIRDETYLMELESSLKICNQFYGIVGASASMQRVYSLIEALADVPTTVLILGESGTGKELVAAALHSSGKRSGGPFVKVNCSALSESLLESELFGHVRGAFTGAIADKVGRFKKADGGTLFLDEIGDISSAIQIRLLRVLQESEFERVGDSNPIKVNVRIIAATNMNLEEKVRQGMFRQDLYYRLNVICLELPPLRERIDDLHLLVTHFIKRFNDKFDREILTVSDNVMDVFRAYDWPGNIRELEHVIERAMILCTSNIISVNDLPDAVLHVPRHVTTVTSEVNVPPSSETTRRPLTIEEALAKAGGNKTRAAKLLGISRWTLYRKL